jgi:general secretion pathway protein B
MSLIYDALRKSEQQRRAGETPTLATDPGWGVRRTPPARHAARWLWGLVPVVLLAGAASAWMLYAQRASESAAAAGTDGTVPTVTQADGASDTAVTAAPTPTVSAAAAAPAVPPEIAARFARGDTFANDPQALVPGLPQVAAGAEAAAASETLTGATPSADPGPAPTLSTDAAMPGSAAGLLATEASMAAPPPPTETTVPPPPAPMEAAPAAPVATTPPPEPVAPPDVAEPALPLVYELPYAVRKDMPKLTLSMHVYNDDPMRRFAIINDERRAEGDDINGVRVIAIRRDGIELEYAGQRFLLPRAGG